MYNSPFPSAGTLYDLHSTGNYYRKTLTAKSDDAVIGSASASVNVAISQDEIDKSKKARDAYEKMQKAKGLVAQGSLDEGIALVNELKGHDPKNAEAATLVGKWSGRAPDGEGPDQQAGRLPSAEQGSGSRKGTERSAEASPRSIRRSLMRKRS